MRGLLKGAFALSILFILTSCATAPSVPFDRGTAAVHTIAVVGLKLPEHASMIQAASAADSVAAAGGFIGGLLVGGIEASVRSNREKQFHEMVDAKSYDAQAAMTAALKASLEARGYTVEFVDAPRQKSGAYLSSYPALPEGADTALDVAVVSYGYLKSTGKAAWRPMLWVKCKLVRPNGAAVLMESTVEYNSMSRVKGVVKVSANEEDGFEKFEFIVADPDKATAGLDHAFAGVSDAIATLLQ